MRAVGQFKHRVTIKRKTVVNGALGQDETWTDIQTRWARLVSISTKAQEEYLQVGYSSVTHEIIFKGNVELIYNTDRLLYVQGDTLFEIIGKSKDPEGLGRNTIIPVRTVPQDVDA